MYFKTFQTNEIIDDWILHVQKFIEMNPDAKIAVGSDSKYKKASKKVIYVTVIAMFYYGTDGYNKGAHLIYSMDKHKKELSIFEMLWTEVEKSKCIAEEIQDILQEPVEIHIDLNSEAKYKSNIAYPAAVGWLKSLGFDVFAKPNAPAATCAADLIANRK